MSTNGAIVIEIKDKKSFSFKLSGQWNNEYKRELDGKRTFIRPSKKARYAVIYIHCDGDGLEDAILQCGSFDELYKNIMHGDRSAFYVDERKYSCLYLNRGEQTKPHFFETLKESLKYAFEISSGKNCVYLINPSYFNGNGEKDAYTLIKPTKVPK